MFLLIDNYDSFTYNLVQAFQVLGQKPVILKNDDPRVLEIAGSSDLERVCLSPGPGHPDKAGLCLEFLKILETRMPQTPVLGVCLGHQILGTFAGAEIYVSEKTMHGKASEIIHDSSALFYGLPETFPAARYHSLLVKRAPAAENRFIVTAWTGEAEVMGLEYSDRPWAGIQFHPESVMTPNGEDILANFLKMGKKS